MVAEPQKQLQMQTPPQPQPQPQKQLPAPSSAEDEALKRNTDCVYFLASPLTCKKGSECEYRHSEYARVNPRDCWFWLNGNCLNPKCSFRHPPLDGLLGTQMEVSAGSSLAPPQPALSAATQVPCNASKQAVPCIFFQKGMCFKGDRCAFLHGPSPIPNKAPQASSALSVTELTSFKRTFGGPAKCTQEQKILQASIAKPVEASPNVKPPVKSETTPVKNDVFISKNLPPSTGLDAEVRCKQSTAPVVISGSSANRTSRVHQSHASDDHSYQNGKDADESLRESSPGFDVLVDDDITDADYYRSEDQYGRTRGHEDQFNVAHSADYMIDVDRERLHDPHGFDSYDRVQGQYTQEHQRNSVERKYTGAPRLERRGYPRADNPDHIDESDLRHRLSKQRRVSGLRSVINVDRDRESLIEGRNQRGPRRDSSYMQPQESTISSRFRGRINLSQISSPNGAIDTRLERDSDRGRNRGRLSPGKSQTSSQLGRLRDRIKGVVEDDFTSRGRNVRGPHNNRDIMVDRDTEFAGPKSLAELKGAKNGDSRDQSFSSGRQRNPKVNNHQQNEGDLLFEGPKPLSVILKRKRETEEGELQENDHEDSTIKENKAGLPDSSRTSVEESKSIPHLQPEKETNYNHDEESKYAVAASAAEAEENTLGQQSSELPMADGPETENGDGMIDETMEEQELEGYDQRDGDYDYEQYDGEEYDIDGGENGDADAEYSEDDDGEDDFAKKIGVLLT